MDLTESATVSQQTSVPDGLIPNLVISSWAARDRPRGEGGRANSKFAAGNSYGEFRTSAILLLDMGCVKYYKLQHDIHFEGKLLMLILK